jgi:hypothetical protein
MVIIIIIIIIMGKILINCARHYLARLVTLGLVLVLRLAPRKRYLVMILN